MLEGEDGYSCEDEGYGWRALGFVGGCGGVVVEENVEPSDEEGGEREEGGTQ